MDDHDTESSKPLDEKTKKRIQIICLIVLFILGFLLGWITHIMVVDINGIVGDKTVNPEAKVVITDVKDRALKSSILSTILFLSR